MRNKSKFIEDLEKVVKPEILQVVNFVEDAAHTLNHEMDNVGEFSVREEFTTTGKVEEFVFTKEERPKTDNPEESIPDWFYKGRV